MDTITIFENTLKTVTVVHADKELIFKLFIFSWSIIRVIKSMFHEFDNNNFVLNNNIWIWPISLTNQDNPLFYNEKGGLNNALQLFTLHFLFILMFWRRNKKPRWDNYIYIINQATKSYFNISDLADLYSKIKKQILIVQQAVPTYSCSVYIAYFGQFHRARFHGENLEINQTKVFKN